MDSDFRRNDEGVGMAGEVAGIENPATVTITHQT